MHFFFDSGIIFFQDQVKLSDILPETGLFRFPIFSPSIGWILFHFERSYYVAAYETRPDCRFDPDIDPHSGGPGLAADPLAGGGFTQVAISAKNSDSPTLDLDLALYRRNSSNAFTKVESMDYVTPVKPV